MKTKIQIMLGAVVLSLLLGIYMYSIKIFPNKNQDGVKIKEKIGIGIITTEEKGVAKFQAFADYLNKWSDDSWYIAPVKDYGSFLEQLENQNIKAAFVGSAIGYRIIKEGIGAPIARGEKDGISTSNSYIFSRKDSGLDSIESLRGKKFAYVDMNTSSGYLYPVYLLKMKGYDPENFFRVASFLGSEEKTIEAVLSEEYDAGATKDLVWEKMAKDNPNITNELQILATGGPFPEEIFIISAGLGQDEIIELKDLLTKTANSDEGRAFMAKMEIDRFIDTSESDFIEVKKITNF